MNPRRDFETDHASRSRSYAAGSAGLILTLLATAGSPWNAAWLARSVAGEVRQATARRAQAPPAEAETGGANASLSLTLRSVRVVHADLDDREDEFVEFTFGEAVHEIVDRQGFQLSGPDSDSLIASASTALVKGDPRAVLAGFPAGTDVRAHTLGVVKAAVVRNRAGEVNLADSAPLRGSRAETLAGPTPAPDLLWVQVDASLNWIRYVYDEHLDEGFTSDPARFGFYTRAGRARVGDRLIGIEDNVATVAFDAADQVQEGVRFFALEVAVKGLRGHRSLPRAVGARTTQPDLIAVRRAGDTLFDFVFDEPITRAIAGVFAVYSADGARHDGRAVTMLDSVTVRIVFPTIHNFGHAIVLGVAEAGAAAAADGSAAPSTLGAATLEGSTPVRAGRTTGPDLVAVDIDARAGFVTFIFDERLEVDVGPGDLRADRFAIVTSDGTLVPATLVADIEGERVIVLFPRGDLEDAQAATVEVAAVTDEEGNPNPPDALILPVAGALTRRVRVRVAPGAVHVGRR